MSQDALALSPDETRLSAVKAGSSSAASFAVDGDLSLVEAEPAQGVRLVRLTASADGRHVVR